MRIEIGQTLSFYEISGLLGAGGMGKVYRARDTRLGRDVALKVLPPHLVDDPERMDRLEREAKALATLQHSNIVTVFSIEQADDFRFLTMELVEGKTLGKAIPRGGMPLSQFYSIGTALAAALYAAHRKGIIHRDLKPDNIILDSSGQPKILDFGLARIDASEDLDAITTTALTREGQALGTLPYMAPEQFRGEAVDSRADIFSLGVVLYQMITGAHPFPATTMGEQSAATLRDTPPPLGEYRNDVPRHLNRILARCLEKDPDRRIQTALDLRNELASLEVEDDPEPTKERSGVFRRIALPALTVLFLVAFVVTMVFWRQSEEPHSELQIRPMTSAIEWDTTPNWSPEAEFLAFSRVGSEGAGIFVRPVAGGDPILRADGPGDDMAPRWSPDGRYLAYVGTSREGSFVFLISPHGGGTPRRVFDLHIPPLDLNTICSAMGARPWSSDARSLLVSRMLPSGQTAIHRVDVDTGEAEQLTFPAAGDADLDGSYSFNGKEIVFQRQRNGLGTLWTMSAAGGEPEALLVNHDNNILPAWRPDNRRVVFGSNRGAGSTNLWEIDTKTGAIRQIYSSPEYIWFFSVSSDDRIAFSHLWHDTFLFSIDVESGEMKQLTSHTRDNFGARFCPTRDAVAYHSTRTGDSEIWIHDITTDAETRLTHNAGWDVYPDWSPDGERLVFVTNREGAFTIWAMNADGGNQRRLINGTTSLVGANPVNASLVARWSPDGQQIAYLVNEDQSRALWTVRPDGSEPRERLQNVHGFDWYRDSDHAICTLRRPDGKEFIAAVDLQTGQQHILFEGPHTELDVAPDGGSVAFCGGYGHVGMMLYTIQLTEPFASDGLPRAKGEPVLVPVEPGLWHAHIGGWSPDSKRLVFTWDLDYGDIYEVVEAR